MHRPRVNLGEWIVLIDDLYLAAICLHQLGEKRLMHPRAERTLEVVVIDNDDLGIFIAALRTSTQVDRFHHVLAYVKLLPLNQCLVVLRYQEVMGAGTTVARERDWNFVVTGDLAGFTFSHGHAQRGWQTEGAAHLLLNYAIDAGGIIGGL